MKNKLIIIILFIFIFFSCDNKNKYLYGKWNVLKAEYKGVDLRKKYLSRLIPPKLMQIDDFRNKIIIYYLNDKMITANFKYRDSILHIYNSSDYRFNGDYIISIVNLTTTSKNRMEYELELKSDSMYIFAEKTIYNPLGIK